MRDVLDLVGRFEQMRDLMGQLGGGGGLLSKIPGMGNLAGAGVPGDFDPSMLMGGGGGRQLRRASQAKRRRQAKKSRRKGRKK